MQWQTNLPLIAILRGITPDEALAHVGAVIDAGFDAVEIPLNSPQWEKSIPQVVDAYGEQALIGAGTVLQPEQVDRLAAMGCRLIVTPNIQPEVIRRAVGYGMTVCPATGSDPASGGLRHDRVSRLRHRQRSLQRLGCRCAGAKNFPVIGFWPGLHQSVESRAAARGSGLCRWRRDAGKPGAVD